MKEIEIRKGPGGKTAYIAGTRTRVSDIVRLFQLTQDERAIQGICASLPHLDMAQIRVALAWWHDHQREIDDEIEEETRLLEQMPAG